MICKGVVKDNLVVLEEGIRLPEGTLVEVRPIEQEIDLEKRKEAVAKLKALGEKLRGRNLNLGKYVLEARREIEERV